MSSPNGKIGNCKCLQPIKIILLTTSNKKKYIVSLKPRRPKAPDKISLDSEETPENINNKTIFQDETHTFDTKFTSLTCVRDKAIQKSQTTLSLLQVKNCIRTLRHPATYTSMLRLAGGWGQEGLSNTKRKNKTKPESKTTDKNERNKFEQKKQAFGSKTNDSVLNEKLRNEDNHPKEEKLSKNKDVENMSLPSNKDDAQSTAVLEDRGRIKNRNQTKEQIIHQKSTNCDYPPGLVTSSVVENLIEETSSVVCGKCDSKNPIPVSGDTDAQLRAELFCTLPSAKKTLKRIDMLEGQVTQMNFDVKNLQNTSRPSIYLENYCGLSKHLSEVHTLLVELKGNISKLQNIALQMTQEREMNDSEAVEMIFQNYLPNAMELPAEDSRCRCEYLGLQQYGETCNCKIYREPQRPFAKSRCTESTENWPVLCNCLQYLQQSGQHRRHIEGDEAKSSVMQHRKEPLILAVPHGYRKSENLYCLSHQPFRNEAVAAAASYGGQNSEIQQHSRHTEQPSSKEDAKNFADDLTADSSTPETVASISGELPLTTENISKALWKIIGDTQPDEVALTVHLESHNLYFINVSLIRTGQCLGYIYTNEVAFKKAKDENIFDNFLMVSVLNSKNSLVERNQMLRNSFEFIDVVKDLRN